jgi:hypothetical protein
MPTPVVSRSMVANNQVDDVLRGFFETNSDHWLGKHLRTHTRNRDGLACSGEGT